MKVLISTEYLFQLSGLHNISRVCMQVCYGKYIHCDFIAMHVAILARVSDLDLDLHIYI